MKSGTSSLYNYLAQHSEICPCFTKEPEYFSEKQGHRVDIAVYEDLWKDFDDQKHKYAIEASTGYTKYPFEKGVAQRMKDYGIEPKMIYVVRNPISRILSQNRFMESKQIFNHGIFSDHTVELSKYFQQLEEITAVYPKSSVFIADFDELNRAPKKLVKDIFRFLELPQEEVDVQEKANISKELSKTGKFLDVQLGRINRHVPGVTLNKKKILNKKWLQKKHKTLSESDAQKLKDLLKDDIEKFGREYNFDVSKWGF